MTINIYPAKAPIDILIQENPNITYVDLGECEEKLKAEYNLSPETKFYILGVDSTNKVGKTAINYFNYEIYLENGTTIKDLSACNELK